AEGAERCAGAGRGGGAAPGQQRYLHFVRDAVYAHFVKHFVKLFVKRFACARVQKDEACCWRCKTCGPFEVRTDEFHCAACSRGERAAPASALLPPRCEPIPEQFIDYADPWAIAAMAVASIGILVTVIVALIFWTYSETPVIKASGRELSLLLLLGTLLSFCVTFVVVARPSPATCGLSRFFLGFCYTLYTSPKSQLLITAGLTSVEVVINLSWLLYVPPQVTHVFPTREERFLICEGLNDHSYMVSLLYPFVLIGFCTAYAIKTRKCPGGFNETKHIGFTNYTAIIIWLAFVPLYIASTSHSIRIVTLAISLSLSGLVQLGCLFFPKMYIVLFKPEKNTKEVVMSQHRSSSLAATPTNLTPVVVLNGGSMQYLPNTEVPKTSVKDSPSIELSNSRGSPSPSLWRSRQSLREGRCSTPALEPQSPDSKGGDQFSMDQLPTPTSPERRAM
ncbi:Metabotropic glutamate receptor, partial [Gryllus bimaculatus]